ncbi:hypothetical protein TNCV_3391321 [Trichonephila clavipes]|nr:hypothetical protein TNCV_3391321 [Trichonephila clavipes]
MTSELAPTSSNYHITPTYLTCIGFLYTANLHRYWAWTHDLNDLAFATILFTRVNLMLMHLVIGLYLPQRWQTNGMPDIDGTLYNILGTPPIKRICILVQNNKVLYEVLRLSVSDWSRCGKEHTRLLLFCLVTPWTTTANDANPTFRSKLRTIGEELRHFDPQPSVTSLSFPASTSCQREDFDPRYISISSVSIRLAHDSHNRRNNGYEITTMTIDYRDS